VRPKPIRPAIEQKPQPYNKIEDLLKKVNEIIERRGQDEIQVRGMAASDELHCTSAPTADTHGRIISPMITSTEVNRG